MTTRSFADAVGYVMRNQDDWNRMVNECWWEWAKEFQEKSEMKYPMMDHVQFKEDMLQRYGIDCFVGPQGAWDFHVVDYSKYMFFQMKYAK